MDGKRLKILIVDDNEMNREMLIDILNDQYDIMQAADGSEAVDILKEHSQELDLLLLDILMPKIDGFGVLSQMNIYGWLDQLPVVMISSETKPETMERAFDMGVADFISRPFVDGVVRRRVRNTVTLYAKQKKMRELMVRQIEEREKEKDMMVTILSHIVESRNGESGLHVIHIGTLTRLLLYRLLAITDKYHIPREDISAIRMASALHDIGKIIVPEEILNKPGKLTAEEFAEMKKHTVYGETMLKEMQLFQGEKLLSYARQICRHHHERWDGGGYPDGLKGDEIPVIAQVVSLADVYDALVSERCYKKAYSHEKAMQMILNGECGQFNPLLLRCLTDISDEIKEAMENPQAVGSEKLNQSYVNGLNLALETIMPEI